MNIHKIIKIQKCFRFYSIRKNILIPSSYYQTKDWRINGKHNECEIYQRGLIEKIIKKKLDKTYDRINMDTCEIISNKCPMKNDDGFEWTEDFDGKIINNNIFYFNLKFICDIGGSQTRTLCNVYNFIKYQIYYLLKFRKDKIYFINILDGDTCYNNMNKFKYLLNKYPNINKYIFIGSLYDFQKYYQNYLIYIP